MPYDRGDLISRLHDEGELLESEHVPEGTRLRAKVTPIIDYDLAAYTIVAELTPTARRAPWWGYWACQGRGLSADLGRMSSMALDPMPAAAPSCTPSRHTTRCPKCRSTSSRAATAPRWPLARRAPERQVP